MTPAELRTLREACGLSLPQLAALCGVRERTARYWESGRSKVPSDVAATIAQLDASLTEAAHRSARLACHLCDREAGALAQGSRPREIILLRYSTDADLAHYRPDMRHLSTTTHAALLYRTRSLLREEGLTCRIIYMRAHDYEAWRGQRPDDEATRAQWAALQRPDDDPDA